MISGWLGQLLGLYRRSAPLFIVVISAGLAAFVVLCASSVGSLQRPTVSYDIASHLGGASVKFVDDSWFVAEPGETVPELIAGGNDLSTVWSGSIPVALDGNRENVVYKEASWPSVSFDGFLVLVDGSWPTQAGECVTSPSVQRLSVTIGEWPLHVTGAVRFVDHNESPIVLCAQGTWERWEVSPELVPLMNASLSAEVFYDGPESDGPGMVAANGWPADTVQMMTRSSYKEWAPVSVNLLTETLPWLLVPTLALAGAGVLAGRWLQQHSRILHMLGGRSATFSSAVVVVTVAVAIVTSVVSSLLAVLFLRVISASVVELASLPGEVTLNPSVIMSIALASGIGALVGVFLGSSQSRTSVSSGETPVLKQAKPHRPAVAALILLGLWLAVTLLSNQSFWLVSVGLILLSGALACVSMVLTRSASNFFDSSRPGPFLLATRQVRAPGKNAPIAVFTAIFALISISIASITANGSVFSAMSASVVPSGYAAIGTRGLTWDIVPQPVLEQFGADLGVSDPIHITESLVHPLEGVIWNFASLADAESVLGDLTEEQQAVLLSGGILEQAFQPSDGIFKTIDGRTVELQTVQYSAARENLFGVPGFALQSALKPDLSPEEEAQSWWLYRGLSPAQDVAANKWRNETGFTGITVYAYQSATIAIMTIATMSVLIAISAGLAISMAYLLRGEARQLRGVIAGLEAAGLPRRWSLQNLLLSALWLTLIPILLAFLGSAMAVAVLEILYPDAFDPFGVPWWVLIFFAASVLAASTLGAVSAARNVRHGERMSQLA